MDMWTYIMIAVVVAGIGYMVADKLILPIYRGHQNKQKAARWIYCHFFHPTGGFPEHALCEPVGSYHVRPPAHHKEYFLGKSKESHNPGEPLYCLIGTIVKGYSQDGKPITEAQRTTVRDLWPPDARSELEKVIVESAYFVIGREQALNPYQDFLPINTAQVTRVLREEKSMQYVANLMSKSAEMLENLDKFLTGIGKTLTWIVILAALSSIFSLVATVLIFMVYRAAK